MAAAAAARAPTSRTPATCWSGHAAAILINDRGMAVVVQRLDSEQALALLDEAVAQDELALSGRWAEDVRRIVVTSLGSVRASGRFVEE